MKHDRLFIQIFAVIALCASGLCIYQENAFGAIMALFNVISLVFISRNIRHLVRSYRNQKKILCALRLLVVMLKGNAIRPDWELLVDHLEDIQASLDHIKREMPNNIE